MGAQGLIKEWIARGVKMQAVINQPVRHDQFPLAPIVLAICWSEWCKTCQFPTCFLLCVFKSAPLLLLFGGRRPREKTFWCVNRSVTVFAAAAWLEQLSIKRLLGYVYTSALFDPMTLLLLSYHVINQRLQAFRPFWMRLDNVLTCLIALTGTSNNTKCFSEHLETISLNQRAAEIGNKEASEPAIQLRSLPRWCGDCFLNIFTFWKSPKRRGKSNSLSGFQLVYLHNSCQN